VPVYASFAVPEQNPAVQQLHLEQLRRRDRPHLVPFDVDRADIVGLQLEPATMELADLAGEPVAVSQLDDITLGIRLNTRRQELEPDSGKNDRRPDYSHLSTLRRTDQRGCGADTVCPRIQCR